MSDILNCLIIGSGPAGYTAAIYAARANLKPVLYTGLEMGGQLMLTTEVENFPGYPESVMGPQMMEDFKKQAERMGTDIRFGLATQVDFTGPVHKVQIDSDKWLEAHTVILATGAVAKWLGLPSEQRLNGHGVSACAVCDGFFFRGQDVAVVGAGDTAAEEATYLSKLCHHVHLLVRKDFMRASKVMQERVMKTPNITVHWNTETDEIIGDKTVEAVRIRNVLSGVKNIIPITGFFVAIGHKPNSEVFRNWIQTDEQGYVITLPGTTRTSVEGVFAAGDLQDRIYRQAVTAAGSGCMAALDAERYLGIKGLH
jgi:thioredoxin reductase (NADPH)